MLKPLLKLISPHTCCSCGRLGSILCDCCKKVILDASYERCIVCLKPTIPHNLCRSCSLKSNFQSAWAVGERTSELRQLIDVYKFERASEAGDALGCLLAERLPCLPDDTVICYVPDIPAHRRQRGGDHMKYIAQVLSRQRGWAVSHALQRRKYLSQRQLSKKERLSRQLGAFRVGSHPKKPILLIDDVYTTGATLSEASKTLVHSYAAPVWVAVVARQPRDY